MIIANCPGVTTLDTSGFISGHQEHLLAPLVVLSNPCIVLSMQFFGKVRRTASPDVVLQLVKSKCLPALCYGVDVCPVNKSQTASLQYVVDNCFRRIFDVKSTEIVRHCMSEFKWLTMCDVIDIKKRIF